MIRPGVAADPPAQLSLTSYRPVLRACGRLQPAMLQINSYKLGPE